MRYQWLKWVLAASIAGWFFYIYSPYDGGVYVKSGFLTAADCGLARRFIAGLPTPSPGASPSSNAVGFSVSPNCYQDEQAGDPQ